MVDNFSILLFSTIFEFIPTIDISCWNKLKIDVWIKNHSGNKFCNKPIPFLFNNLKVENLSIEQKMTILNYNLKLQIK